MYVHYFYCTLSPLGALGAVVSETEETYWNAPMLTLPAWRGWRKKTVGTVTVVLYPAVIAGTVACKEKSYAPALANKGFTFKFPIDKNSLWGGLNIQRRQLCVKGILGNFSTRSCVWFGAFSAGIGK
jgi:hypothetical protein